MKEPLPDDFERLMRGEDKGTAVIAVVMLVIFELLLMVAWSFLEAII